MDSWLRGMAFPAKPIAPKIKGELGPPILSTEWSPSSSRQATTRSLGGSLVQEKSSRQETPNSVAVYHGVSKSVSKEVAPS